MRKLTKIVGVSVVALALAAGVVPHFVRAADNGQMGNMPSDVDMPHRTAQAFAPFLKAVVSRRMNVAERIFKVKRNVTSSLGDQNTVRILGRFTKPDQLDLNLIGGRTLGKDVGILLFTVATEDAPVAFKVYYYAFGQDMIISRMEVVDDWDDVERLASTVDLLQQPITVSLASMPDQGQ
jgi:hypothetical protein